MAPAANVAAALHPERCHRFLMAIWPGVARDGAASLLGNNYRRNPMRLPKSLTAIAFTLAFMLMATTAVAQGRPPSTSDTRADWCRRNAGGAPTAGEVILRRDWGEHRAIVTNQDTRWAVAKLRGVDGRVAVAAFVAPRWTTTIADIPAGQYRIEFAFGDLWSRGCNTFVGDASAHRFPDYDAFTTEFDADGGRVVQNWRYTITPVRNGNVRPRSMSMAEFDAN